MTAKHPKVALMGREAIVARKQASEARRRETKQSAGRPLGGEAFPTLQLLTLKVSREVWERRRIRTSKLQSLLGQIRLPSFRPYLILTMDELTRDYCITRTSRVSRGGRLMGGWTHGHYRHGQI
ncbi:hypothetical protein ASPFODRAFT_59913 [Aspergillus luchuensis CBS 106.47]|uniref:Uncharacterized protein n=1 Tax=Aspergillus luchuensis (strain CBS 106.47) TaxID=1137211 RepID=A0A1M3TL07_ASPLC|nr:hypothetical protein ASPFODRAFT_59913 [Aspergillus luchuensis CBS 106.47]